MKKKFSILVVSFITFFAISSSSCFATTNVVNATENAVQNGASTVGNVVSQGANAVKNTISGTMDTDKNQNARNTVITGTTNNYNATRTNATTNNMFSGMPAKVWTWAILAVVGIVVIWMTVAYSKQNEKNEIHSHNE